MANQNQSTDEDVKTMVKRLLDSHAKLDEDVRMVLAQNAAHDSKITSLSNSVHDLVQQMDKMRREKNVIIFNLPEVDENNRDLVATIRGLFAHVQLTLPDWAIEDARRVGKPGTTRPVLVKVCSTSWVHKLFTKAADLRKMKMPIENDMSATDRIAKKNLYASYKSLKSSGANVTFKRNRLFLDGRPVQPAEIESDITRASLPVRKVTSYPHTRSPPALFTAVTPRREEPKVPGNDVVMRETNAPTMVPYLHLATAMSTSYPSFTDVPPLPRLTLSPENTGASSRDYRHSNPSTVQKREKKKKNGPPAAGAMLPFRQTTLNFLPLKPSTLQSPGTDAHNQLLQIKPPPDNEGE